MGDADSKFRRRNTLAEDFIRLKELANDIHLRLVKSLYANIDEVTPQAAISSDELDRIIGLTESRLNLE